MSRTPPAPGPARPRRRAHRRRPRPPGWRRRILTPPLAAAAVSLLATSGAWAGTGPSLPQVLDNLRNWVMGLLVALATVFLTLAGLRYLLAAGDPAEVEKAKSALKSAVIGYALAALAPVLVDVVRSIVGG